MVRKSIIRDAKCKIESAIEACSGLGEVRVHLVRALNALADREERSARRSAESKAQELPRLRGSEAEKALGAIEEMIADERKKIDTKGKVGLING